MSKRITYQLFSSAPTERRDSMYHWGKWEDEIPEKFLLAVREAFAVKKIQWYTATKNTIDYSTGLPSIEIIENKAHEEIPPLELNTAAKGYVPPPKAKEKAMKFAALFGAANMNQDL